MSVRANIADSDKSACSQHSKDVACASCHFVHDPIRFHYQLAETGEIREMIFERTFWSKGPGKWEVPEVGHGILDSEKPFCCSGDIAFNSYNVVDFVELFKRGGRPYDVHIPCLSRNCRIAESWSMPRPSAISLRDLRTVSARRNTSISGSKSAALTRTASARPLRVTTIGRCVSFTRARHAARLFRH